ncbi:MAG: hypothetical protein B6D35_11290 [Candidatus Brocadia sp. UTAMX2]|jgi:hopene-associated glycosyltransferase HpnB|nr:MAG: hypothetical protein B6D35_11290 [Candidatus Brocadia sp. UTAMX2]
MGSLILFIFGIISAITWLVLLCMPKRWRISERWDITDELPVRIRPWPTLSVIIPARNESASLSITLPSWLKQDYPASEIILVDDESSDDTAEYARKISAQANSKVQVLNGTPPPPGWSGKLWALEQGVRISSGEWLLFTDADIYHNPHLWQELVAKAIAEQKELVSLMALLDTRGFWARLLIPAFVYFFHFLYPFAEVEDVRSKTSAAAGGCILVSRKALNAIGGIAGYCDAWIDDIALAIRIKRAGMPISLSLTKSAISIRPYFRLREIWNMVARNAFAQLHYSWLLLIGTVAGLFILFVSPLAGIGASAAGKTDMVIPSGVALVSMAFTYFPTIRFFNLNAGRIFSLPVAGLLYLAMTFSSAWNYLLGWREWRGSRKNNANKTIL